MAVARITAPKRWFRKAAGVLEDAPRAKRELLRAVDRHGLTAELTADEVRMLAERLSKDPRAQQALENLEAAEQREKNRPRARDVILARMQREGRA